VVYVAVTTALTCRNMSAGIPLSPHPIVFMALILVILGMAVQLNPARR
jgi:hypothetical protein